MANLLHGSTVRHCTAPAGLSLLRPTWPARAGQASTAGWRYAAGAGRRHHAASAVSPCGCWPWRLSWPRRIARPAARRRSARVLGWALTGGGAGAHGVDAGAGREGHCSRDCRGVSWSATGLLQRDGGGERRLSEKGVEAAGMKRSGNGERGLGDEGGCWGNRAARELPSLSCAGSLVRSRPWALPR